MGRFFGIGLGPGEPELITLKAYRVLQRVDTIFVPRAEGRTDAAAER
ncbi:MAG TPA: precorrin-2 C(20)-methyltransferase, partial [Deltaproteobacteria bacterium]|nr:precorrin-2 C(20)-methyltransferase [Deltaproteobacteria bacterium]